MRLNKTTVLLLGLLVVPTMSCGDADPVGTPAVTTRTATSLSISVTSVTMTFIGETATLTATIRDQNGQVMSGTVTWSSDDVAIATVDATGKVSALRNGSTTVRVTLGALSAAASVSVAQVAAALAPASGDAQTAPAGAALAQPLVVRATDQGGAAVSGVGVAFAASTGSGAVAATTATTDDQGLASTTWTLGSQIGPQQVTASLTGSSATVVFTATAESAVPIADLVGTVLVVTRSDPSSLESVQVQSTIRNDGNLGTGVAFPARLFVDDIRIASENVAAIDAGANATITLDVGPLAAGAHVLRLELDPDDSIAESNESNNTVLRNQMVLLQTAVPLSSPLSSIGGGLNDELLFRFQVPAGASGALTVVLSGGSGDVDMFIERGSRPTNRTLYDDCVSAGPTADERCVFNTPAPGTYHVLLHAFSAFSATTMTVSTGGAAVPYDIELIFLDHGTAEQDAAVVSAATRWMELITTDLPDIDFSADPVAADACIEGQPAVTDVVDDLRIYVRIVEIDGPGSTLAQAGPCVLRGGSDLPVLGSMEFDAADLDGLASAGEMLPVVLHEMGHVLGIGTIWSQKGLLQNPSIGNTGADTHFTGALAIQAFNDAGGSSYTGGAKVPVENQAGEGSSDAHWREATLGEELMTPFFNRGLFNPLSAISIQSLADVGYTVDVSASDGYSKVFTSPSRPALMGPVLDLRGDARRGPMLVVDRNGRVIQVIGSDPAGAGR